MVAYEQKKSINIYKQTPIYTNKHQYTQNKHLTNPFQTHLSACLAYAKKEEEEEPCILKFNDKLRNTRIPFYR